MIFNMVGGGGGSGATLVVSSPANVSVTVSKDDKSYTKNSGSLGSTTFKGLATGTWTVTISGNGQTATKTIEITADYAITIAFFAATINVTYPAGSTCAITTDITNYSDAIFAGDTSGYWSFTIPYAGTWLVACFTGDITNPEKLAYKIVSIATDGQSESVTLSYELYIFKSGVGMTSGYSAKFAPYFSGGDTSSSINKNAITWATNAAQGGNMVISPAVDLSSYNTLHVELDYTGHYDGGYVTFGVGDSAQGKSFNASTNDTYNTSRHTITIDVSAITSNLYIKSYSRQTAGRFYNIWLT